VIQDRRSPGLREPVPINRLLWLFGLLDLLGADVGIPAGEATTIARHVEAGDRPIKEYELCAPHAESVAERENG
jgi:hypothetical protein